MKSKKRTKSVAHAPRCTGFKLVKLQGVLSCPKALPLFCLGRKGILKTQSGLQIAYLSGVDKSDAPEVYH